MVDAGEIPMSEIKSTVLDEMVPGVSTDPMTVIEQLHSTRGISTYDLKAAIWYLIGDRSIRFDDQLNVVRAEPASFR